MSSFNGNSKKKVVLEEDEYADALETIIERDFYPDLRKLKNQSKWLDTLSASRGMHRPSSIRRHIQSEQRRIGGATPSALEERALIKASTDPNESTTESNVETSELTLNEFVATHTSEDNASFEKLQEKDLREHRLKYSWAYDDEQQKKTLLLPDGRLLDRETRLLMDAACEAKPVRGDDRPNGVETWKYRARNPLLFPPDLATNRDICRVNLNLAGPKTRKETMQLENGQTVQALALPSEERRLSGERWGKAPKAPKIIQYHNSRFRGSLLYDQTHDAQHTSEAYERSPGPGPNGDRASECDLEPASATPNVKGYKFVQMTPSPAPGGIEASPFTTWGDIEGTPMILDPTLTPFTGGPSFEIREKRQRESLADGLEAKHRKQSLSSSTATKRHTPLPKSTPALRGAKMKSKSTIITTKHGRRALTPAAQRLAKRLQRTPQSFNAALRSSYGNTPLHSGGAGGTNSKTRVKTPGIASSRREKTPSKSRKPQSLPPSAASLTDNLLNLPE